MPSTWKTVPVFISSTFRDMHAERDHLVKVTFPALREKLLPHRVELYDIDLRWGITEDEAKNEKVIGLCLEQVDECRPFFLAFLGHRYGWVPNQIPEGIQKRFPFVGKLSKVSVTELEIRYGVMQLPTGMHVLVLLRDEKSVESIPSATRQKDFVETDPALQTRLAKVKQGLAGLLEKLLRTEPPLVAGGFSLQPYSAVWNPKRYDRNNRTHGKLDGLEDFGKRVEKWLWEAIRTELKLPDTPTAVDPLNAEADLHERFLEMRTRIYVGRAELYHRLCSFALAAGEIPLLLTGESGLGKSAALARFVRDFRKEHPDVFVLPHFVGASPRTTSLAAMLQRLTQELQQKFNLTLPKAESPEAIIRTFIIALTSLPESARVVLVFDALNQLDADSRADSLVWLPERLPPNVRVLCSSATGPQKAPRVLTAFGEREYVDVPLKALRDDERRDIIKAVPKLVAKTLDDVQIGALLSNPATRNPLFLMVALEELRGYGSFERLNQMIDGLPRAGDAVTQLFDQVFKRLEQEFNKPLVEGTLRLLACSRRGLSGPELVELTRKLGVQADDLYPVLRQLRAYLQVRGGLFDFYHMSIWRAVEIRYLQWHTEENQRDPWARWNPKRQPPANAPTKPEKEARQRLIEVFVKNRLVPRSVDELPWQLLQLQSWQRLQDALTDPLFFEQTWLLQEHEVHLYWRHIEAHSPFRLVQAAIGMFGTSQANWGVLFGMTELLMRHGESRVAAGLFPRLASYFQKTKDFENAQAALGNAGIACFQLGEWDSATVHFQEQEQLAKQLNHPTGMANALAGQAAVLASQGESDAAQALLARLEELVRRTGVEIGSAHLGTTASLLLDRDKPDAALAKFQEQKRAAQASGRYDELMSCLGNMARAANKAGRSDEAEKHARAQEELAGHSISPETLLRSLDLQASVAIERKDYPNALELYRRQDPLCRQCKDVRQLVKVLCMQASLLFLTTDQTDQALPLTEEARAFANGLGLEEQNWVHNLRAALLKHRKTHHT